MKRGQLTNQSLPIIAFNLESCFFNNKTTFVNELFKDKYEILGMQYNPQYLDTIMKIWKSGKYSIHLVTYKDPKEWKELEGFLFEKYLYFNSLWILINYQTLVCLNRIYGSTFVTTISVNWMKCQEQPRIKHVLIKKKKS